MAHTLIRTYDSLASAESARTELLGLGIAAERMQLTANEDEAGPVDGNFVLDAKDTGQGPLRKGLLSKLLGTEERTGAYNTHDAIRRAGCQLTVETENDVQQAHASQVMERHGGIDVMARTERALQPRGTA